MKTNQNRINSPMGLRICLYVMLLAFGSCSSCKKDQPPPDPVSTLPPQTQTGANTFGAMVDGVPFIPERGTGFGSGPAVSGGYRDNLQNYIYRNNVWINAGNSTQGMTIWLRNVGSVGVYQLNFDTAPKPQAFYPENYISVSKNGATEFYTTTNTYAGTVEVTRADTINKIVSGRFSFTGLDRTTGKTIQVTNGRFDCKTGL